MRPIGTMRTPAWPGCMLAWFVRYLVLVLIQKLSSGLSEHLDVGQHLDPVGATSPAPPAAPGKPLSSGSVSPFIRKAMITSPSRAWSIASECRNCGVAGSTPLSSR